MVVTPGNRIELLVETTEASSALIVAPVNRDGMDAMMGDSEPGGGDPIDLLTVTVSRDSGQTPEPVPAGLAPRICVGCDRRPPHLDFAMGMAGGMGGGGGEEDTTMMAFTINDHGDQGMMGAVEIR